MDATKAALGRGWLTERELSSILGRWNSVFQVRRPHISVWGAVYVRGEARSHRFQLTPPMRQEVCMAVDMSPPVYRSCVGRSRGLSWDMMPA